MRDTRLIFVEGLPGSGKTTTSWYIARQMYRLGLNVRLFPEVEPEHPLNVGGAMHPAGDTKGGTLFGSYNVDAYIEESLQRWRGFAGGPETLARVNILDSYPYQNSVRVLLQMDASEARIQDYAREVEAIAAPLEPVLVFLHSEAATLERAATARGEAWAAYAVELLTDCPYAVRRGLAGMPGALAILDAYNTLMQTLLASSTVPRLELDPCGNDWTACYDRINEFLGT
ncbi:MAG TPA: hypothetical protein VH951_07450 [Dehalococcoidia bacterium]